MNGAQKERPRAASTAGTMVDFHGENNMNKVKGLSPRAQGSRRSCIPPMLPKLVVGTRGAFLVYSGLRIPATAEQVQRHLACLQQHLQEVAHAS
ncbi:hypothetical protein Aerorivi_00842 [Aeromonas rivipollensis]